MNRKHSVLAALSLILLASLAIQVIPIISAPPAHPGIPGHPVPPRPRSNPGQGSNTKMDPLTLPKVISGTYYKDFRGASVIIRGETELYASLGTYDEAAITFVGARTIIFDNVVIIVKNYDTGLRTLSRIIKLDTVGVVKGSITIKFEGPIVSSAADPYGNELDMIYFDNSVGRINMNTVRLVFSPSKMISWVGDKVMLYVYGIHRVYKYSRIEPDYIGNIYASINLGKNIVQHQYLRGFVALVTEGLISTFDSLHFHGFPAKLDINNLVINSFTSHTSYLYTLLAGLYTMGLQVNINNLVIKDVYVDNPQGKLYVTGAQVDSYGNYPYTGVNIGNIAFSNFKGKLAILTYNFFTMRPVHLRAFIHYDRAYVSGVDIHTSYSGSSGIIDYWVLYTLLQADIYPDEYSDIVSNFTVGSTIKTFGTYLETMKDAKTGTTEGVKSINLFLLAIPSTSTILRYYVGPYHYVTVFLKPGDTVMVKAKLKFDKPNPYQILLIGRGLVTLSLHDSSYHNSITLIINGKVMHVSGISFGMLQGITVARGTASLSDGRSIPLLSMPGLVAGFTSNRI